MRSFDPNDDYDMQEMRNLNAQPWQARLLSLNPEYVHWGPFEDYMCRPGRDEERDPNPDPFLQFIRPQNKDYGWEARMLFNSWKEHTVSLDELNEVVHFYFSVNRESEKCNTCNQTGYHPDAMWISETFYAHMAEKLRNRVGDAKRLVKKYPKLRTHMESLKADLDGWYKNITQDEVDALVAKGRLFDFTHTCEPGEGWKIKDPPYRPTAEEVNEWAARARGVGHDAINRHILIEARLKRLEMPKTCPDCEGRGYIYTAPAAHVSLTYWLLHPRKGASRGVEVKNIQREDLDDVFKFLKEAAERNAARFEKVVEAVRIRSLPLMGTMFSVKD